MYVHTVRILPGLDQFWQQRATHALNVDVPVLCACRYPSGSIGNGFVEVNYKLVKWSTADQNIAKICI